MSLGIAFKGPEGIVLAADSRVTLTAQGQLGGQNIVYPASYDNATKLLRVANQNYVGVVTYGLGVIGQAEPRTAHSLLPEFEAALAKEKVERLPVREFADRLSTFFMQQWSASMPTPYTGQDMVFLIGGYDEAAPYGKVFEMSIPGSPDPREWHDNGFGITWGGKREFTDRIIQGFDPTLPQLVSNFLKLTEEQKNQLEQHLRQNLSVRVPYQFLPLQDCVDLSIFLIRTTAMMHNWIVGIRGVGGAIDVAIITKTKGFVPIQEKKIYGESH
jgi:hypothetical protein